jgi:formylmethanofuran dehydrogenase subunit B
MIGDAASGAGGGDVRSGDQLRIVRSATCLGCGCTCDDVDVVVRGERIIEARNACALGVNWFGDGVVPSRSRVAGRDVPIEEALEVAARLIARSARPLIYLAPDVSCDVQREAVALADALHAALDSVTSATASASVLAAQQRGFAAATLGEVRNRADVLVFWGIDPALRYPRYTSRYAPEPAGLFVPDGRRSRTVVAVDVGDSYGPADADARLALPGNDEVATLMALAALASGAVADGEEETARAPTGAAWAHARSLELLLRGAHYVVIVAEAEPDVRRGSEPERDAARAGALVTLAQALNGPTRCALSTLRAGGNRSGADAVMTWQTGYPLAVDFWRGFPRYRPSDGTAAARLAQGEVDAILLMGSAALIPGELLSSMASLPCAIVGPRASESALGNCDAVIDTGVAGIHEGGTALRMDDVPLVLRASVGGARSFADLVPELCDRAIRYRDTLRFWHPRRTPR